MPPTWSAQQVGPGAGGGRAPLRFARRRRRDRLDHLPPGRPRDPGAPRALRDRPAAPPASSSPSVGHAGGIVGRRPRGAYEHDLRSCSRCTRATSSSPAPTSAKASPSAPRTSAHASDLMRGHDSRRLPRRIYKHAAGQLDDNYRSGTSVTEIILVIAIAMLVLALLVAVQVFVTQRSNRILNVALIAATVIVLVLMAWTVLRFVSAQDSLVRGAAQRLRLGAAALGRRASSCSRRRATRTSHSASTARAAPSSSPTSTTSRSGSAGTPTPRAVCRATRARLPVGPVTSTASTRSSKQAAAFFALHDADPHGWTTTATTRRRSTLATDDEADLVRQLDADIQTEIARATRAPRRQRVGCPQRVRHARDRDPAVARARRRARDHRAPAPHRRSTGEAPRDRARRRARLRHARRLCVDVGPGDAGVAHRRSSRRRRRTTTTATTTTRPVHRTDATTRRQDASKSLATDRPLPTPGEHAGSAPFMHDVQATRGTVNVGVDENTLLLERARPEDRGDHRRWRSTSCKAIAGGHRARRRGRPPAGRHRAEDERRRSRTRSTSRSARCR